MKRPDGVDIDAIHRNPKFKGREKPVKNVEAVTKTILAELLGINAEDITGENKIVEDLGADSLDQVELFMALEDEFNIAIPDEDAEKLATFSQLVEYLKAKVAAHHG